MEYLTIMHFPWRPPLWAANPQKINSVNNTATEGEKLKWLDAFCFLLLMEMWWEGIRVRGRLALQHDSVLFFPGCVVVDSGRACRWKIRGTREVGDDRARGRRIDGGGGVLRRTPASIQFFCTAVDAADYGIGYLMFFFFFFSPRPCFLRQSRTWKKSSKLLYNKNDLPTAAVCVCFGACWRFWLIQPPTGCISIQRTEDSRPPDALGNHKIAARRKRFLADTSVSCRPLL